MHAPLVRVSGDSVLKGFFRVFLVFIDRPCNSAVKGRFRKTDIAVSKRVSHAEDNLDICTERPSVAHRRPSKSIHYVKTTALLSRGASC